MDQLLSVIRDSGWGFLFGIIGILLALVIYFRQKERPEISYEVLLASPLLEISKEASSVEKDIEIRFQGVKVDGLSLYVIRIANTGNRPITPEDYNVPLSIIFDTGIKVVAFDITEARNEILKNVLVKEKGSKITVHKNANPALTSENGFELPAVLLNKGDWFTLKLIAIGNAVASPSVAGRIIGVDEIKQITTSTITFTPTIMGIPIGSIETTIPRWKRK